MMLGFFSVLYFIAAVLLILLILIQRGKGSMGLGALGGGTQMLFGGSGGQDLFQKITWVLGTILIFGSLGLAFLKVHYFTQSSYLSDYKMPVERRVPATPPVQGK